MQEDGPPPDEQKRSGSPWLVLGLIAVTGVAVAFAFLWSSERTIRPQEVTRFLQEETAAVEEAAGRVIDGILDYDAESIGDQREKLLPLVTGGFLEDYEELLGEELANVLAESNTMSEGEIVDGPTIGFVTAMRAQAVARAVQRIRTDEGSDDRLVLLVVRVGMVKEDGSWKAEELKILSQQSPGSS